MAQQTPAPSPLALRGRERLYRSRKEPQRLFVLVSTQRARARIGWYNRASVVEVNEKGEVVATTTEPLGAFNKRTIPTEYVCYRDGAKWRVETAADTAAALRASLPCVECARRPKMAGADTCTECMKEAN